VALGQAIRLPRLRIGDDAAALRISPLKMA
jgi:hypothetical protein